jgi:hypothetical protein
MYNDCSFPENSNLDLSSNSSVSSNETGGNTQEIDRSVIRSPVLVRSLLQSPINIQSPVHLSLPTPAESPAQSPMQSPQLSPFQSLVHSPVQPPVLTSVQLPVQSSIQLPVQLIESSPPAIESNITSLKARLNARLRNKSLNPLPREDLTSSFTESPQTAQQSPPSVYLLPPLPPRSSSSANPNTSRSPNVNLIIDSSSNLCPYPSPSPSPQQNLTPSPHHSYDDLSTVSSIEEEEIIIPRLDQSNLKETARNSGGSSRSKESTYSGSGGR